MLSDEDKARIKEEEQIRMDVRKDGIRSYCCHKGHYCDRHCWIRALGVIAVVVLVIGLFCHHGHYYHNDQAPQNQASQTIGK